MTTSIPASTPNQFRNGWTDLAWLLDIEPNAKFVLLALIKHANWDDGSRCFPSLARLAKHTRLSDRTVRRALRHLEELQILTCISHPGYSNEYSFGDLEDVRARLVTPDTQSPLTHSHPCPVVTPDTMSGEGGQAVRGGRTGSPGRADTVSADHSQGTESDNKIREQVAAATHTREGERTHEASQPAAGQQGQVLNLDHEQQQAAPSKPSVDDAAGEASPELVQTLGTLLASRIAVLVRKPGDVTPAMLRPTLRTLKRWAGGDEGKVKEYLFDELDRQEGRDAHERAAHPGVLLKWLADKKSWSRWQAAAASATPAAPDYGPGRDKSIPVGRPPRPGMKWNSVIGDWTNSTAQHTGVLADLLKGWNGEAKR